MKQLTPMDNHGIFADTNDTARANSLIVAKMFEKEHKHIFESIRKITEPKSGLSEEFRERNFALSSYKDPTGRKLPCYEMMRDGFTLLAMGFTGSKAMRLKEAYIKRFNEMEHFIRTLVEVRHEFPILTESIKLLHENPKPYHCSNECDLINGVAIGMSAKQFRISRGIQKGESIRPHLTEQQIHLLDMLQKVDIGLLVAMPDYQQRKRQLAWYRDRLLGVGAIGA